MKLSGFWSQIEADGNNGTDSVGTTGTSAPRRRSASGPSRPATAAPTARIRLDDVDATPVGDRRGLRPVQAHRAVRHVVVDQQRQRRALRVSTQCVCVWRCGHQLDRCPARRASQLLIEQLPQAARRSAKAAFGRPFLWANAARLASRGGREAVAIIARVACCVGASALCGCASMHPRRHRLRAMSHRWTDGWAPFVLPGKMATTYAPGDDDGRWVMHAKSERSASMYRRAVRIEPEQLGTCQLLVEGAFAAGGCRRARKRDRDAVGARDAGLRWRLGPPDRAHAHDVRADAKPERRGTALRDADVCVGQPGRGRFGGGQPAHRSHPQDRARVGAGATAGSGATTSATCGPTTAGPSARTRARSSAWRS